MTENTDPTTAAPTSTAARYSLDRWLTMWNTDGEIAREICADGFGIPFAATERDGSTPADAIRTAEDFARYLGWWHMSDFAEDRRVRRVWSVGGTKIISRGSRWAVSP